MSSNFDKDDKDWLNSTLLQGKVSKLDAHNMFNAFEAQTDHDIETIKQQLISEAWLRRVCLYKCIMFPFEMVVLFFVLGRKMALDHTSVIKVYYKFFRKKITFAQFQKELNDLIIKGKVL
jgi:hypothetical protein